MAGIDDRIEESKNWFERLMQHIPGYKGYKEKELGREADKIERVYVAERVATCLAKLDALKLDLISAGKLKELGDVDVAMRKVRRVRDKVQFADYGYAGLFDTTKVGAEQINQLYAFDKEQEVEAGSISDFAAALTADSPSLATDLKLLDDRIEAFEARFAQRETLITGAGR